MGWLLAGVLTCPLAACVYMGEDLPGEMQEGHAVRNEPQQPQPPVVAAAEDGSRVADHVQQVNEQQQREALNVSAAESSVAAPAAQSAGDPFADPEDLLPEQLAPTAATAATAAPGVEALLAQARWALKAGRLTHPAQFNARDYFQRVLMLDPGNKQARAGLQQVLDRSIELSLHAANQGKFKQAELLLTRAERFALNDPGIRGAREYVHRLSRRGERSFPLPAVAVRARDAAALAGTLKLIAKRAVENNATVEINTAEDLQGLWLFEQLRLHAGDDPLHATIQAAQEPAVRLTWRR